MLKLSKLSLQSLAGRYFLINSWWWWYFNPKQNVVDIFVRHKYPILPPKQPFMLDSPCSSFKIFSRKIHFIDLPPQTPDYINKNPIIFFFSFFFGIFFSKKTFFFVLKKAHKGLFASSSGTMLSKYLFCANFVVISPYVS